MSPSVTDARGVHASTIVDRTPSPVARLATTSLVVRMSVEDGPDGGGKEDVPWKWSEAETGSSLVHDALIYLLP